MTKSINTGVYSEVQRKQPLSSERAAFVMVILPLGLKFFVHSPMSMFPE